MDPPGQPALADAGLAEQQDRCAGGRRPIGLPANGVTWTQGLDPSGIRRPASYATTGASVNWTSGAYTWDGTGNVKALGASAFGYDGVSRLLSGQAPTLENGGSATGLRTQSATFDGFGNLTSLTTNGTLVNTPTAATTNRLTAASYDAAGNVTAWNGNTFTWDSVGMPTRTLLSGLEYNHVYTADDERVLTYQPNVGYRWTLRDLDGRLLRDFRMSLGNWTVERDLVYREGALLAAVQPSGEVYHLHTDHLGSPRLITGNGGVKRAFHSYYAFGDEATAINQDTERMKFTGHERDLGVATSAADDIDYMHARYYLPQLGRFLAVDPVLGSQTTPQSWNRYVYTLGNPVKYTDPTGLLTTSQQGLNRVESLISRGLSPIPTYDWVFTTSPLPSFADDPPTVIKVGGNLGWRPLTSAETEAARNVFGDGVDYSQVRIYDNKFIVFQNTIMAPNGNIYWPGECGNLMSCGGAAYAETFIHEMTHVFQFQNGVNVLVRGFLLHLGRILSFGHYDPYRFTYDPGRAFSSYNIEQQGEIAVGIYVGLYPNNINP